VTKCEIYLYWTVLHTAGAIDPKGSGLLDHMIIGHIQKIS